MVRQKLNYLKALLGLMLILVLGCSKEDEVTPPPSGGDGNNDPIEDTFDGPTYADDYTPIASWSNRSQWNLANIHDPTVVKQGNYWYMYQTDASYGNAHDGHGHFHGRRSTDLVNWEYLGSTMDQAPTWVKDSMNDNRIAMGLPIIENPNYGYWAPAVTEVNGVYRMYYSLVVNELIVGTDNCASWGERPYIGMMETTDLASNNWEDKGMVVTAVPDGLEDYYRDSCNDWSGYYKFNAIDPSYIQTPEGEHWLIYGSWHTGIAAVQLDPITGKPFQLETIEDYGTRIAGRGNLNTNRWQGLEGAEIIYNEDTGYYYLFLAYDELSKAYNTRVARSTNILGPYIGMDGGNVSEGAECWPMLTHPYKFDYHTGWVGFSHCSIFKDPVSQKWYYASQARLPEGVPGINVSNAVMMGHVREIRWTSDGWPAVAPERFADVPETEITEEDIVGSWQQITMQYQYQVQQTAVNVNFYADGTVAGGVSGTWELDSNTRTIYINGAECKLMDAWDWERSPRKVTITYTGFTDDGRPIWGKKN
ncbi:arabinan endo-1,5-alpha-L-arabinosidase [Mangrovimonas sp. AS39]|uniref:arabinan endo-1,5-alpha-L-arabinosidase n=1 Tax=Mangrovimonas futianensis TaxID=2895523 RepID=UPI001E29BC02|nr:arabinan endo-1,5-alpha-L-arabinosidase [Mangrovimonas futianensis]MCF1190898.1 arabinan endo-1,5-alpha-L-arabinosidase [Mangrovimonas futianensis]MCF1194594.1 arabinan endo-1,5-alpha-L-arabinosidase [Mangrovimonas futianensis]